METILITTGLACIIAAIVGGGLEAFNIKVPSIISSIKRQVLLGIFGIGILAFGIFRESSKDSDKQTLIESIYYKDGDGDGYGNRLINVKASIQPTNYVNDSTDYDDNDKDIFNLSTAAIFYADVDRDGFGDRNKSKSANKIPANHVKDSMDCDDRNFQTNPSQTAWFEAMSSNSSFDYNCDGIVKKESEKIYSKTNVRDHRSGTTVEYIKHEEGWEGRVPDCGKSGIYITIERGRPKKATKTQRCN